MQTFELGKFLNRSLVEQKKYAQQKNIEFTTITDFAFDIIIRADKRKIKTLLKSVITSTIDHSAASSIVFSVRQLLKSDKEILLDFSLEDNGSVSKSLDRFSYFRSLVANRSLIEELKGKSEFVSSPDSGSILKFIIGCELIEIENDAYDTDLQFLNGKKILVVDDNEINRTSIVQFFQKKNIDCSVAPNGIRAIDLLEQNNLYDLILMDILMPQMDGFETAAYIRKQLKIDTPIIAMPARDKTWVTAMCKEVGIDKIIHKPFAGNHLLKLINNMLTPVICPAASVLKIA